MKLGIIGAMTKEVETLVKEMMPCNETQAGIAAFYAGTLYGREVVLARSGVGKVHAGVCAQLLIERCQPDLILNIGVAGALLEEAAIGDVVIADCAVQHDVDTSAVGDPRGMISGPDIIYIASDKAESERLLEAAGALKIKAYRGTFATGDQFIAGLNKKRELASLFGAVTCEMECGAIAQVCYENHTPYIAYRAISDTLAGGGAEYEKHAAAAAGQSARLLRAYLQKL